MNVYWNKSLYLNCGKNLTVGAVSARAGVTDHLAESSVFLVGCSIFMGKTTVYSGCGRQGTSVIENKIIFWSNLFKKVNPTTSFSRGIKIDLRCFCLSTRIKLEKMLLLTRQFNSGKKINDCLLVRHATVWGTKPSFNMKKFLWERLRTEYLKRPVDFFAVIVVGRVFLFRLNTVLSLLSFGGKY